MTLTEAANHYEDYYKTNDNSQPYTCLLYQKCPLHTTTANPSQLTPLNLIIANSQQQSTRANLPR